MKYYISDTFLKNAIAIIFSLSIVGLLVFAAVDIEEDRNDAIVIETHTFKTENNATVQMFVVPGVAVCLTTNKNKVMDCNWVNHE